MKHYHILSRISIYLLSLVMIVFGVFHFIKPHDLLVYVPPSLPGGIMWAYFTGSAFILVGLAFITNNMVKAAGYLLAGLLILFVLIIHIPNYLNAGDPEMRTMALINILKDTAIAGFAMHIAAGAFHQHMNLDNSD
jgi:putative oxidoreductase